MIDGLIYRDATLNVYSPASVLAGTLIASVAGVFRALSFCRHPLHCFHLGLNLVTCWTCFGYSLSPHRVQRFIVSRWSRSSVWLVLISLATDSTTPPTVCYQQKFRVSAPTSDMSLPRKQSFSFFHRDRYILNGRR